MLAGHAATAGLAAGCRHHSEEVLAAAELASELRLGRLVWLTVSSEVGSIWDEPFLQWHLLTIALACALACWPPQVRGCLTGKDWWYDNGAVRPVHMRYVPEELRAGVRPKWVWRLA